MADEPAMVPISLKVAVKSVVKKEINVLKNDSTVPPLLEPS